MRRPHSGFHFQPLQDREITSTDNAPLLFNCNPPGRKGKVTVFLKTRRTLRRRLGVHDLGQIESVLQDQEPSTGQHCEMREALNKMTQWRYLFPPEMKQDVSLPENEHEFSEAILRSLAS
ncbi:MAG: hypothetical protein WC314_20535 [Vulcanimicrobiota bacterium]